MIGELLRVRGERNVPRNPTLLAERAFHTTSDFPLLLSAAANKMLLAAYQPAAPSYRQIFLRRDFRDFKPHRHLRVGDFPTLMPLMENGEIQAGTMSESQEIVLLQTFARRIRVTRPMLVNDGSVAAADRQRLSQEGSFARAESSLITSRVAQQREFSFPAAYWTEAEALARAEKWRAVLETGPRMVRVLTDRFLGQIEIGQIGRITYPAFGFAEGFVGVVVGWRESLTARRVEITLWGAG
jgi:hypothetical protein